MENQDDTLRQVKKVIFIYSGVILMLSSASWLGAVWRFTAKATSAQGVVIRLNHGGSHPQVRFITSTGQVVDYAQNGLIFGYRKGDKVEVLYDSIQPTDATVNSFGALWGFPIQIFMMGVVFVIGAQIVPLSSKEKVEKPK
jgi:Protein of unknown function (DUF3592)